MSTIKLRLPDSQFLVLSSVLITFFSGSLDSVKAANSDIRELHFPAQSIGRVYQFDDYYRKNVFCCDAKGKVLLDLNSNKAILLELNSYAIEHLDQVASCYGLANVNTLGFSTQFLSDSWFKKLSVFSKSGVKGLKLDNNNISDSSIPYLLQIPSVISISLARTKIKGSNLSILRNLDLKFLNLARTSLAKTAFQEIARLRTLEELSIDEIEFEWLKPGSSSAELDLLLSPVLASLGQLSALKSLGISGLPIGAKSMRFMAGMKQLAKLRAERSDIDGSIIALLRDAPLVFLNLAHCRYIDDASLVRIAEHKTLSSLKLSFCKNFGAVGLLSIGKLSNLKDLSLAAVKVKPSALSFIKNLKKLNFLDLDNTELDDDSFLYVSSLAELKILYVSGTKLTDKSVPLIAELKGLRELNIDETVISEKGYLSLKKSLPGCKIIWH